MGGGGEEEEWGRWGEEEGRRRGAGGGGGEERGDMGNHGALFHGESFTLLQATGDSRFENFTLFVIVLNALWIGYDTETNAAPLITKAHVGTQAIVMMLERSTGAGAGDRRSPAERSTPPPLERSPAERSTPPPLERSPAERSTAAPPRTLQRRLSLLQRREWGSALPPPLERSWLSPLPPRTLQGVGIGASASAGALLATLQQKRRWMRRSGGAGGDVGDDDGLQIIVVVAEIFFLKLFPQALVWGVWVSWFCLSYR